MSSPLILIPTVGEQTVIAGRLKSIGFPADRIQLCGFGPIAAASRTTQLLLQAEVDHIYLAGIAGGLQREYAPGTAITFSEVAIYGIGAGAGDTFRTAGDLGWNHWKQATDAGGEFRIGDRIPIADDSSADESRQLLTVCSAASTQKDVHDRRQTFPDAVAEDMEGFSVAFACAMAGCRLSIIRGISNVAGDRDKAHWRITDALNAASDLLIEKLK